MSANDLRQKATAELKLELDTLLREQFNLRMQKASGELNQNHEHSRVRKDIARVKTVLNELARTSGESE